MHVYMIYLCLSLSVGVLEILGPYNTPETCTALLVPFKPIPIL